MVAYSFAPQFVAAVESLKKRQTVRGYRKRHARPGEAIQIYAGMRTRSCRKLIDPDPVCIELQDIIIAQGGDHWQPLHIELAGRMLTRAEIEEFAVADGFGDCGDGCAAARMAAFWLKYHGPQSFGGVLIRWRPR